MENNANVIFNKVGVKISEILLPSKDIPLTKWSVVACDQYTSQPEYWEKVETIVDGNPSTLRVIFPEVYLENGSMEDRIKQINKTMLDYLDNDVLVCHKPCFIYIDRKTSHAASRKGLILAVDLEHYDYAKGSQAMIRATEGTVIDRLPPRVKIRENALLELPHIMLLIDDPHRTVIEPIAQKLDDLEQIYDFELMMDGGHIKGYKVDSDDMMEQIASSLAKLSDPGFFSSKYQVSKDLGVLLFAVGDGNHSLASAKVHWENLKRTLQDSEKECHPARYALVEVVNVHDEGLAFEPIHRIVFNVEPVTLLDKMVQYFGADSPASYKLFDSKDNMQAELSSLDNDDTHIITFVFKSNYGYVMIKNPKSNLEVGSLQSFLDSFIEADKDAKIDYIHGEDVTFSLGSKEGNIGFCLPSMDKHDLFKTVILDGALPRKTFSMGEAEEKRFYLECRKIR